MQSFDDRPRSPFGPTAGSGLFVPLTGPLPAGEKLTIPLPTLPGTTPQQAGSSTALVPMPPAQWSPSQWSPALSGDLSGSPGITRVLTDDLAKDAQTGGLRTPVVIKGTMKRTAPVPISPADHKKRRLFLSVIGMILLFLVSTGTLFAVTPLGHEVGVSFPSLPYSNLFSNNDTNSYSLLVQATATAVYHRQTDGYVPPGALVVNSNGSLSWPLGQCTYWANDRYHTLTGHWVGWTGNADQWVSGARAAGNGWMVDTKPHVPSILVLMPYVQGATGYGHVAVVESINADGSVHTSNMNWYFAGGGWDRVSYYDFTAGSGAYFVYHT